MGADEAEQAKDDELQLRKRAVGEDRGETKKIKMEKATGKAVNEAVETVDQKTPSEPENILSLRKSCSNLPPRS